MAAALLSALVAAAFAEARVDRVYSHGPLSLSAAQSPQAGTARTLATSRLFGQCLSAVEAGSHPRLPSNYHILYAVDSRLRLYACYEINQYGSVDASAVLTTAGSRVSDTHVIEQLGAWGWVDPFDDVQRIFALVCSVALIGLGFYLGRTRPAAGTGQRVNRIITFVSFIPVLGLMYAPAAPGLTGVTRRRLAARNIAIVMAFLQLTTPGFSAPTTALDVTMAVLQRIILVLALVASLTLPRARKFSSQVLAETAALDKATAPPAPAHPGRRTENSAVLVTVDVAAISAASRRLYWLAGAFKFSAIFFALGVLAPSNSLRFTWGRAAVAGIGILALFSIAMMLQENWIRPAAALAAAVGIESVILFGSVLSGVLTAEDAESALIGFLFWPAVALWVYRRRRRSSGLSDAEIQAATRIGHVPAHPRQAGSSLFHMPSLMMWIRGTLGILGSIPVIVMGALNTVFGYPVISDWIQAALDKIFVLTRTSGDVLVAGFKPKARNTIILAASTEPGMWCLRVRGDLFHWGKLGPQSVPFEEFLRTRLKFYADVRDTLSPGSSEVSMAVVPVGAPLSLHEVQLMAALAARVPLLLILQPARQADARQQWAVLAGALDAHGIALPALDDSGGTLGMLHLVTGQNIRYVSQKRDQWGYMSAIEDALRFAAC